MGMAIADSMAHALMAREAARTSAQVFAGLPPGQPRTILVTAGTEDTRTRWRHVNPCRALESRGHPVGQVDVRDPRFGDFPWPCDLVSFASPLVPGACVVADYDDDILLSLDDYRRAVAREGGEEPPSREDRLATPGCFDAVTVSTPALAALVRTLTDAPVFEVPHLIDLDWWASAQHGGGARAPH